jgi:hypothetical protein
VHDVVVQQWSGGGSASALPSAPRDAWRTNPDISVLRPIS